MIPTRDRGYHRSCEELYLICEPYNVLPLRIIISGTRVHGIAQLCSPRRPCHRLGGLQPGTALQTASKNSNVRPFHSSKGVFTAPPSEPSIAACPCPCSSPPWRCKLLCGCQRLLLSTVATGLSATMAAQVMVTWKRTASRALLSGNSCSAMRIVVARLHMAGRRVPSHASYH